nr:TrmH family RNA methyltransferase [Lachnospiraceae bacterium]
ISKKENVFVIGEFEKKEKPLAKDKNHIVLVNPSNAGNIGTIMRSALGFGFSDIAIVRPAVDVFDPKAVRASMGALFSLNVKYYESFEEYLSDIGDSDGMSRTMYPFMLQAKKYLHEVKATGLSSLIFGNEATGLPQKFLEVGTPVIIPITDKVDSLNLPIAASIAMHKVFADGM